MKSCQLHIYLSPELKEELEGKAKLWGLKIGEYIRYIILQDLYYENKKEGKSKKLIKGN